MARTFFSEEPVAEPEAAKTSNLPERIGAYQIVRRLGAGGMAETFEAVLRRPGGFEKRVCIKRILYPHSNDAVFREEFFQEARVLAQLDHPGIVDAYDYGDDDGHLYLVMKLVDGVDFAQLLDHYHRAGRQVPPGIVAYTGAKIAEALHYLHHFVDQDGVPRHIIHRDVSPSNILISRTGHVLLADLGIATFSGRPKLTQTHAMKGKLGYMSPEHIEKHRGLDPRSDLFSLGAVLYEGFAAERPFDEPTQIGTHHAILEGRFPPLLGSAPHLDPPELAELVEQTLSPDKERRPSTGLELAFRLRMLAPHPNPRATLAAAVSECSDGSALRQLPPSATYYTGDPLARAASIAAKFRAPSQAPSVTDTAPSVTSPREVSRSHAPIVQEPSRPSKPPATSSGHRRFPTWMAVLLAVAATGALGVWMAVRGDEKLPTNASAIATEARQPIETKSSQRWEPETNKQAPAPPVPGALDTLPATPATGAARSEAPSTGARPPAAVEAAEPRKRRAGPTGAIKVRVINWGYIWLDGEFKGKSPMLFDNLSPGIHELGVGQTMDKPTRTEKIRVQPGQYLDRAIQLNDPLFK